MGADVIALGAAMLLALWVVTRSPEPCSHDWEYGDDGFYGGAYEVCKKCGRCDR